jgi:EAL domain-containing protein (putative c-di-GMP-specific phosphodiesterase class I)
LSSFSYLKNLPVDYLKIDGSFVKEIVEDSSLAAMVEAINHIGHILNLKTIAEFVKDDAIAERLRLMGVDFGQGYALGKPEPLKEQLAVLKTKNKILKQPSVRSFLSQDAAKL